MGTWRRALLSSILIIWIFSQESLANPVQNAGSSRSAKVLEDSIMLQDEVSSEKITALQDSSDRSLSVEQNMMLYRSVFTLSLKLLTVFLLFKLFNYVLTSAGLIRPGHHHAFSPYDQEPYYYGVDVNHNPAVGVVEQTPAAVVTTSTAGAGGVVPVAATGGWGVATASSNARPSFLAPANPLPRFRFSPFLRGRHPPPRQPMMPPHPQMVNNMGDQTHMIETHSHLYVLPDGTQARVPMAGQKPIISSSSGSSVLASTKQEVSIKTSTSSSSSSSPPSSASASTTQGSSQPSSADSVSITNESSSAPAQIAESRSSTSTLYKDKPSTSYDDWIHFKPGGRSL